MRALVVLNAHSSRTAHAIAKLPELLAKHGIEPDPFEVVADEKALRRALKRGLKRGLRRAIVGGGDGSMTTAADVLANSEATLGVLPLGTGNSFALSLGVPDDLDAAVALIANGDERRIDLGVVNGVHFANFVTIGLAAEVADAAPHALKPVIGPAAYVAGGFGPFARHRPFVASVTSENGSMKLRTHQIIVASGRYFGHQPILPEASLTDHRLAFFTTTGLSKVEVARAYLAMLAGQQTRLPDAVYFTAKTIAIKAKPKQSVSIDGNPFGRTPLRFSIAKKALGVVVAPDVDLAKT